VSTMEAYAEDKDAKAACGRTKEIAEDHNKDLLIIFIIHLTNITESKPECIITRSKQSVNH